jgi:hypothetical protein
MREPENFYIDICNDWSVAPTASACRVIPSGESLPLPEQQIGALHDPSHRTSLRYVTDDCC